MIGFEVGGLHISHNSRRPPQRGQLPASSGCLRTFEESATQCICCAPSTHRNDHHIAFHHVDSIRAGSKDRVFWRPKRGKKKKKSNSEPSPLLISAE